MRPSARATRGRGSVRARPIATVPAITPSRVRLTRASNGRAVGTGLIGDVRLHAITMPTAACLSLRSSPRSHCRFSAAARKMGSPTGASLNRSFSRRARRYDETIDPDGAAHRNRAGRAGPVPRRASPFRPAGDRCTSRRPTTSSARPSPTTSAATSSSSATAARPPRAIGDCSNNGSSIVTATTTART